MIKITADSTCDLSPDILDEFNITLTPLTILVGDEAYHDGIDITPASLFRYIDEEKKTCRTTAVNTYEYQKVFGIFSSKHEAVIHICIGSHFSSCYQNASLAAQDFSNVHVIDSRSLSSGSGTLVHDAALMARDGMKPEDILRKLSETISKVDISFVIDKVDYLHKGGRCSGLEAIGARLFSIKPCIEVVDGKMGIGKKYRGNFENCLEKYVKDRLDQKTDIHTQRIYITHPMCSVQTVSHVRECIQRYADFEEIIETNAGCTVSNHCGPNTLGIIFKHV